MRRNITAYAASVVCIFSCSLHCSRKSAVSDRSADVKAAYAADIALTDHLTIFNVQVGNSVCDPAKQTDVVTIRHVDRHIAYGMPIAAEFTRKVDFFAAYGLNVGSVLKVDIICENIVLVPAIAVISDSDKLIRRRNKRIGEKLVIDSLAERVCLSRLRFRFLTLLADAFKTGVYIGHIFESGSIMIRVVKGFVSSA